MRCGIPGDGADIELAERTLPVIDALPAEADRAQGRGLPAAPRAACEAARPPSRAPSPRSTARYPLHLRQDRRRPLPVAPQRDGRCSERALRAAGVPVRYTEGYNPHIRLSMGPALAVGHEGLAEAFDVDCTAPVRGSHVDAMNRLLPDGLRILQAQALLPQAPSLGKLVAAAVYLVGEAGNGAWPADPSGLPSTLAAAVQRWEPLPDGRLRVELSLRQDDGPTATVKELLQAIGIEEPAIPLVRVTRERLVLRPRAASAGATPERDPQDATAEDEP